MARNQHDFTFDFNLRTKDAGAVTATALWGTILGNLLIANVIGFAFWAVLEAIQPIMRWINMRSLLSIVMFYTVLGTAIVTASRSCGGSSKNSRATFARAGVFTRLPWGAIARFRLNTACASGWALLKVSSMLPSSSASPALHENGLPSR